MEAKEFKEIVNEMFEHCGNTLFVKNQEYANNEDVFTNFRQAAGLQGTTPQDALGGMLAKHIVSIYCMCKDKKKDYPMEVWDEKIGDAINYLLLLRGIVYENSISE